MGDEVVQDQELLEPYLDDSHTLQNQLAIFCWVIQLLAVPSAAAQNAIVKPFSPLCCSSYPYDSFSTDMFVVIGAESNMVIF